MDWYKLTQIFFERFICPQLLVKDKYKNHYRYMWTTSNIVVRGTSRRVYIRCNFMYTSLVQEVKIS